MKITLIKQSSGMWKPAFEEDFNNLKKYQPMHKIQVEVKDAPRSIAEHKMFFGFIKFLFENQSYTENKNLFRDALLININHTKTTFRKLAKGKYEETVIADSISFDKCTEKKFNKLFKDLQIFANDVMGVNFEEWKKSEWKGETSCANPDCHNTAIHTHEIFPGHTRRTLCIEKNWQVKICGTCHDMSHGKLEKFDSTDMSQVQYNMLGIWCKVLGLNTQEATKEIMVIDKLGEVFE